MYDLKCLILIIVIQKLEPKNDDYKIQVESVQQEFKVFLE